MPPPAEPSRSRTWLTAASGKPKAIQNDWTRPDSASGSLTPARSTFTPSSAQRLRGLVTATSTRFSRSQTRSRWRIGCWYWATAMPSGCVPMLRFTRVSRLASQHSRSPTRTRTCLRTRTWHSAGRRINQHCSQGSTAPTSRTAPRFTLSHSNTSPPSSRGAEPIARVSRCQKSLGRGLKLASLAAARSPSSVALGRGRPRAHGPVVENLQRGLSGDAAFRNCRLSRVAARSLWAKRQRLRTRRFRHRHGSLGARHQRRESTGDSRLASQLQASAKGVLSLGVGSTVAHQSYAEAIQFEGTWHPSP
jgi:hypothetical protein